MKYLRVVLSFSFLCCLVGIRAQTIEATACSDAYQKNVDSIFSTHTVSEGQSEYWISFTAASSRVTFNTNLNGNAPIIDKVQLFTGSCSALQLLEVDSLFSIGQSIEFQSNLSIGQDYLLRLQIVSTESISWESRLTVKEHHAGPLVIVNSSGDTTYCTFEIPYLNFRCEDLTICRGDTLCFNATDTLGVFTTMGMFIHEVYGQIGEINYNSDSSEACVVFPYSGNQTIIVKPFNLGYFNSLGFSANFPYDNQIDAQGDSIGDYINYLNVNVIDSVPPGTNNAPDGVLCLGATYTLNAFPGSVISTVSINDTLNFAVNSTSWSYVFPASGAYIVTYTEEGLCHPATYTDTILVFDQPIVLVDSNACNHYYFHFIACENYNQLLFNVDGGNMLSFNDVNDTTWSYDFIDITQPVVYTINGVQGTLQPSQIFFDTTFYFSDSVNPYIPQTISLNVPSFLCEMGSDSIFISSPNNLTGISWTTSPSVTFSGQGSNTIQPNGWPAFGEDIQIQVTAKDEAGCPFLGQATVQACCEMTETNQEFFEQTFTLTGTHSMSGQLPTGYYNGPTDQIVIDLPSAPSLANQTTTPYSTATTYSEFLVAHPSLFTSSNVMQTGEWVFFNNDFIVDKDLTILNCQFIRFAPGARILLKPSATLHVQSSTLAPKCQEMWGGIVVNDSTQQVYIDSASIIGATTGLLSDSGGFCQVKNSRFIDNYIGIQIQSNPETITNSTVTSTYFGDVIGSPLLSPFNSEQQPAVGIILKDILTMIIGTDSPTETGNLFHNHSNGIATYHSSLMSYKNNFYNIKSPGTPVNSYFPYLKNGIFAENPNQGQSANYNKTLTVGGSEATRNNFLNCEFGISAINSMHLNAQYNYMKNIIYRGVSAENNPKKTMLIRFNDIQAYSPFHPKTYGIYVKNYDYGTLKIEYNTINSATGSVINRFQTGIYVSEVFQTIPQTTYVDGNTVNNCLWGIWMINIKQGKIRNNTVNMRFSNSAVNYYSNNYVKLKGISVQNSTKAEVTQNTVNRTLGLANGVNVNYLQAIHVETSPGIFVWENLMYRTAVGLHALGNSFGSRIECNHMYYNRNGFYLDSAILSDQGSPAITPLQGYDAHNYWYYTIEARTKGSGGSTNYYHAYDSTLFSVPFLSTNNTPFWQDIILNSTNPKNSCIQFKDTITIFTPEQLRERELGSIVENSADYDSLSIEQKHYLEIACYSRLKTDSSLLFMNIPSDSLYVNYLEDQEMLNSPNKILHDCQQDISDDDFELAILKNSLLPNEYPVYYTNKQVQELWLQRKLDSIDLSGMDTSFLMDIACLDPLVFGSGVYQARAILDWNGECEFIGKSSTNIPSDDNKIINQMHLYPNPSSGIVYIDGVEKLDKVLVHNLNGVVLRTFTKDSLFEIKLDELQGLYIFSLYLTDGTIENHKIIVE